MAFDDKGNLFVADQDSTRSSNSRPDGTRSTFANDLSTVGGSGFETNSMVFDRLGNLFESDDRGQYDYVNLVPMEQRARSRLGSEGDLAFDEAGTSLCGGPGQPLDPQHSHLMESSSSFTVDVSSTSPATRNGNSPVGSNREF